MVGMLYGLKVETLVAVNCRTLGVTLRKVLINHPPAGSGILPARWFTKDDVVGYYYGALVYENMTKRQHTKKTSGESFMQVTQKMFCKWKK